MSLTAMGMEAKRAARQLARATTQQKDRALLALAGLLLEAQPEILAANRADVANAQDLSPAMIDRLTLTPSRLEAIADDLRKLAEMPDPVGEVFDRATLPNGMQLYKQRVPLGVLAVIYE